MRALADVERRRRKLTALFVRRQGFSDFSDRFVTEALARFLFEFRRRQPGAATGVFGLSAF